MTDESPDTSETPEKRGRGIYLLPNLFTTAALFAGFYAIVAAMKGHFAAAPIAIFIAMVMDGLDGRVARLTNTQSAFGAEYDSLSDMVSFGLAPSLVIYSWSLHLLGKVGWLAAFISAAAAALRLAGFNTPIGTAEKRQFPGSAGPAAAAIVGGLVWFSHDAGLNGSEMRWVALVLTLIAGLLMVSNIRYHSFKGLDLRGKVPFVAILAVVLVYVTITIDPPKVLFFAFLIYAVSGPVLTVYLLRKHRRRHAGGDASSPAQPPPTDEEHPRQ